MRGPKGASGRMGIQGHKGFQGIFIVTKLMSPKCEQNLIEAFYVASKHVNYLQFLYVRKNLYIFAGTPGRDGEAGRDGPKGPKGSNFPLTKI